ncbi:MAG: cobalt transporter CbiM [Clostridiales bacterium]|nr:cobalt transporter CbiM [Clostridiales bacterium]
MHIPDGYLGPQTTIPAFAVMAPVWGTAFRRTKAVLQKAGVPTLALCSSFSFLVMMFNVPVAGGSSAHAVGAVLIAILLGPWSAVISVSTALLIQALVFGDGGVLAFGVNCFNMAFVMPFSGFLVFKLLRGKSETFGTRGLAAAFAGSYFGLNAAALCAALEFGIQPLLFRGANGAPLYCPYPISVSVPSMMFAHGLVAGPIEGLITVGAIAYLARYAPHFFQQRQSGPNRSEGLLRGYRSLLLPVVVLAVLTPLGLLAAGTAWGEWSAEEIKEQLGFIPQGFAGISDWWHALLPDYSLPALGDGRLGSAAGYLLSAGVGVILIAALILLTSRITAKGTGEPK